MRNLFRDYARFVLSILPIALGITLLPSASAQVEYSPAAATIRVKANGHSPSSGETEGAPRAGGNGGSVLIVTGANIDVGDGRDGILSEDRHLRGGEYFYRQVSPGADGFTQPRLTVSGNVIIHCQLLFDAEIEADFSEGMPAITIYAGQALWLNPTSYPYCSTPGLREATPWPHTVLCDLASDNDKYPNGGDFQFLTTARLAVVCDIDVCGGDGEFGGRGGSGGDVRIVAHDYPATGGDSCTDLAFNAGVLPLIHADGGAGGHADPFCRGIFDQSGNGLGGGRGGNGGRIAIRASKLQFPLSGYTHVGLYCRGGHGGDGSAGRPGDDGAASEAGKKGGDGGPGGDGGDAGAIALFLTQSEGTLTTGALDGGCGGAGGSGGRGGNGGNGVAAPGGPGGSGGEGGHGGNGGASGSLVGIQIAEAPHAGSGGYGGYGGNGGRGGNGGFLDGTRLAGGNGGHGGGGGSGGDGYVGGPAGIGGAGGAGGAGTPAGQPGKDSESPAPNGRSFVDNGPIVPTLVPPEFDEDTWTIMVYLAADDTTEWWRSIEDDCARALDNIEQVNLSASPVNVLVQMDRNGDRPLFGEDYSIPSDRSVSWGEWNDTRRGWVIYDGRATGKNAPGDFATVLRSVVGVPEVSELNTGAPEDLVHFVNWAKSVAPASQYALIIVGHGHGWRGLAHDASETITWCDGDKLDDRLLPGELHTALTQFSVDLLVLDTCMSACVELLAECEGLVPYVVATQTTTQSSIFSGDWLRDLKDRPDMGPEELARTIVKLCPDGRRVALKPSALSESGFVSALASFVEAASSALPGDPNLARVLTAAIPATEYYPGTSERDLRDFMQRVSETTTRWPDIARPAATVAGLLVPSSANVILSVGQYGKEPGNGLSVYLPCVSVDACYEQQNTSFNVRTRWADFLRRLHDGDATPCSGQSSGDQGGSSSSESGTEERSGDDQLLHWASASCPGASLGLVSLSVAGLLLSPRRTRPGQCHF